jgi:hypothetical protein
LRNKPIITIILTVAGALSPATAIYALKEGHVLDNQSIYAREAFPTKEAGARQRWSASDFDALRPAPDRFWDKVAWCETRGNWRDGGRFAGGLGIAQTTWRNYGGYQFARSPDRATRREQIIIANRISMFGFQTKRTFMSLDDIPHSPFFRPPAGFNGWGCIRNKKHLTPPVPGPWSQRRNK